MIQDENMLEQEIKEKIRKLPIQEVEQIKKVLKEIKKLKEEETGMPLF